MNLLVQDQKKNGSLEADEREATTDPDLDAGRCERGLRRF